LLDKSMEPKLVVRRDFDVVEPGTGLMAFGQRQDGNPKPTDVIAEVKNGTLSVNPQEVTSTRVVDQHTFCFKGLSYRAVFCVSSGSSKAFLAANVPDGLKGLKKIPNGIMFASAGRLMMNRF